MYSNGSSYTHHESVKFIYTSSTPEGAYLSIRLPFLVAMYRLNELPLAVGLRAPQPEARPIRLCARIDGPLSVFGHAVRGDTTPMAAGALPGCRRPDR